MDDYRTYHNQRQSYSSESCQPGQDMCFVERQAFAEIPPRVEYCLTEKGQALVDIIEAIKQFGERYLTDSESASPTSASTSSCCQ
ncbi:MAG TPA: winged helix-turn-helix transcriptional regulator [Ktedonobacteraceae bacterium]|nr:winged helix-turn-helix transcriptional regulator [Ktedonobacteraceae bacterium]